MPNNRLAQISALPDSRSTEQVIREWLVKFAELYRKNGAPYPLTPVMTALWIDSLNDLDAEMLDAACRNLVRTVRCFEFPVPADIRAQIDQADAKAFELEVETEWQKLLVWVRENVFPDTGIRRGAPILSPAVEHAAKAAGGIYFIERCSEDQLGWCRKTFLTVYENVHDVANAEHLLGHGEAKRILNQLKAGPPRKQLEAVKPWGRPESSGGGIPPAEVRAGLNRIAGLPTEEEWQARKDRLKQSALDWAKAHGLDVPKTPSPEVPQIAETAAPIEEGCGVRETLVFGAST